MKKNKEKISLSSEVKGNEQKKKKCHKPENEICYKIQGGTCKSIDNCEHWY